MQEGCSGDQVVKLANRMTIHVVTAVSTLAAWIEAGQLPGSNLHAALTYQQQEAHLQPLN